MSRVNSSRGEVDVSASSLDELLEEEELELEEYMTACVTREQVLARAQVNMVGGEVGSSQFK